MCLVTLCYQFQFRTLRDRLLINTAVLGVPGPSVQVLGPAQRPLPTAAVATDLIRSRCPALFLVYPFDIFLAWHIAVVLSAVILVLLLFLLPLAMRLQSLVIFPYTSDKCRRTVSGCDQPIWIDRTKSLLWRGCT